MKEYKLMALCGKAGSGKDTILREVVSLRPDLFHKIIGCTTRPKREYEKDGVDYHFITKDEFLAKMMEDEMAESAVFNDWAYGTEYSAFSTEQVNIGVFSPEAIDNLALDSKIEMYVYYLEVSDKERLIRQLSREENPNIREIIRRYGTDERDFADFETNSKVYYNILSNQIPSDKTASISILVSDAEILNSKID